MGIVEQNPGIGFVSAFTSGEVTTLQQLGDISPVLGDLIYYDGSKWTKIAIGSANKVLTVSGGIPSWQTASSGGTPGGSTTQVQFNDAGAFGGVSAFTFNKSTLILTLGTEGSFSAILAPDATSINTEGGTLQIVSGQGNGIGAGGQIQILTADGGLTSGDGGSITLKAGAARGGNSNGGSITIQAGAGVGAGSSGLVEIESASGNSFWGASDGLGIIFQSGGLGNGSFSTSPLTSFRTYTWPDHDGIVQLDTSFVDNEIVSGSATTFTLANTPLVGSVHLYGARNRLYPTTDFTISGATITTIASWSAGDLLADYRK